MITPGGSSLILRGALIISVPGTDFPALHVPPYFPVLHYVYKNFT